jgi:uncharacterized protein YukE
MAKAIADPDELRKFARELKRFTTMVQEQMGSVNGRFQSLGDTWQDQEHEAFSEEFEQLMRSLNRFVDTSNEHIPFLLRKAQRIEDYLNQR